MAEEKKWFEDKERLAVKATHADGFTLKKLFKLLQFYPDIYEHQGYKQVRFEVPIGSEVRAVNLRTSVPILGGKHQIYVTTSDKDWPFTTEKGKITGPKYDPLIDHFLKHFPDHKKLARTMLKAAGKELKNQPRFSDLLNFASDVKGTKDNPNPQSERISSKR